MDTAQQPVSTDLGQAAAQLTALFDARLPCAERLSVALRELKTVRVSKKLREPVSQLRYRAYRQAGAIGRNADRAIWEQSDADDNAISFAILFNKQPLATIRVHVVSGASSTSPARKIFPDVLEKWLARGEAVIDSSCFCVEPDLARSIPQLALAAVRVPVVLAQAFAPAWLIATPRKGHEGFYRRNFGGLTLSEPRAYPGREHPLSLVGNRIDRITERIFRHYPAYEATHAEQARWRALYPCRRSDDSKGACTGAAL